MRPLRPGPAWGPGRSGSAVIRSPATNGGRMSRNVGDGPELSKDGRFWWDGEQWRPVPSKSEPTSVRKIALGVVWALVVVLAGLWFINSMASGNDGVECSMENIERAQEGLPTLVCPD